MTRPYDDDDEFFDDEDEAIPVAEEPAPARPAQARPAQARPAAARRPAPAPKRSAFVHDEPSESERPAPSYAPRGDSRAADKVVNLNNGGGQLKVVVAAPKQFEAASEIAEHLRDRRAVLLNLEKDRSGGRPPADRLSVRRRLRAGRQDPPRGQRDVYHHAIQCRPHGRPARRYGVGRVSPVNPGMLSLTAPIV